MKRVLKGILAIVLIFCMALPVLTGCTPADKPGGEGGKPSGSIEQEAGKKLSIMIPGHNPKSKDPKYWQNAVVEQFKKDYPDIEVEWVVAGWDAWETKLLANISANDPVDVLNDGANNNPKFAFKGITQPINPYVNLDNPNLHKKTMDAVFCYGGNYHVAVSETNVGVLFYNKYLFETEGQEDPMELFRAGEWTWDKFKEIAVAFTDKKNKRFGFATEYPYLMFGSNQTSMVTLNDKKEYQLNIDSQPIKHSLEMLRDGWYVNKWEGWESNPFTEFFNGNVAMVADFQWMDAQVIEAKEYGLMDFDYGVVPMPFGPDNKDGVSPITAAGWAIGAGSDCPYAAGELINRLVDGHAKFTAEVTNKTLPAEHVALFKELADKPYCTNSYDSAVSGAYEICQAVCGGQSISQAIAEWKPVYQRKVDDANKRT